MFYELKCAKHINIVFSYLQPVQINRKYENIHTIDQLSNEIVRDLSRNYSLVKLIEDPEPNYPFMTSANNSVMWHFDQIRGNVFI